PGAAPATDGHLSCSQAASLVFRPNTTTQRFCILSLTLWAYSVRSWPYDQHGAKTLGRHWRDSPSSRGTAVPAKGLQRDDRSRDRRRGGNAPRQLALSVSDQ